MKITIATIDDSYKINFDGSSDITNNKIGFYKTRTLGGRIIIRWRETIKKISVNINFLTEEDYKTLLEMWSFSKREIIITCEHGTFAGVLVDETLSLRHQIDVSGNKFYSGTINIEE